MSYCPRSSLPVEVLAWLAARLAHLTPPRPPGQGGNPPLALEARLDAVAAVLPGRVVVPLVLGAVPFAAQRVQRPGDLGFLPRGAPVQAVFDQGEAPVVGEPGGTAVGGERALLGRGGVKERTGRPAERPWVEPAGRQRAGIYALPASCEDSTRTGVRIKAASRPVAERLSLQLAPDQHIPVLLDLGKPGLLPRKVQPVGPALVELVAKQRERTLPWTRSARTPADPAWGRRPVGAIMLTGTPKRRNDLPALPE